MSEIVHVKVIRGSVSAVFLTDKYKKDDEFETTRENALKIDPNFIQILEDLPAEEELKEEVIPEPPEAPEATEENVESVEDEAEKPTLDVEEVGEVQEATSKKKRKKAKADAS